MFSAGSFARGQTVQVPAGAIPEKSVPNTVANGPSSLFKPQNDVAAGKIGLLPLFAQVLTENSLSIAAGLSSGENVGDLKKSAADRTVSPQEAAVPAELRQKSPPARLLGELQSAAAMQVGGDQSAFQLTKSESKSTENRRVDGAHPNKLEKKTHSVSSQTELSALAVSSLLIAIPIQSTSAPAPQDGIFGLPLLPSVSSASQQAISITKVQKVEHVPDLYLGQDARPVISGQPSMSMSEVPTHADIAAQRHTAHFSTDIPTATISAVLPEASSPDSHNPNEARTTSARALEVDRKDVVPKAGEVAGQKTDATETEAIISKFRKTPEKPNEAHESTMVPMQSSSARASLMEMVRMSDNVPSISIALHGPDAVTNSAKQAQIPFNTNAFQQLDNGPAPTATLLHSSSHQIAVGIHDPSLGWLEVQTQSSAGHINATLTAATAEAHTHLAAQAPAITQYLADRQVFVHSLNVHTQSDAQNGASSGGQPHTETGNAREQESGQGKIFEARPVKTASAVNEVSVGKARDASYINVHA
jgi:hypothetical protein